MSAYFITCREIGFVKIGCAHDPFVRMRTLQSAFPLELALEAIFPGAYEREKEFHREFAEHRVRGEWFRLCPAIEAIIASTQPPKRPISVADKKRLSRMHHEGRWSDDKREEAERLLAQADVHFPFRTPADA